MLHLNVAAMAELTALESRVAGSAELILRAAYEVDRLTPQDGRGQEALRYVAQRDTEMGRQSWERVLRITGWLPAFGREVC